MSLSSRTRGRRWRSASAAVAAAALTLGTAGIAFADNVQNDVTVGGDDTITAGGSTEIGYRIASNNGDGQTGCNAADGTAAIVTLNLPADVTATSTGFPSPPSTAKQLTFTACSVYQQVTFSSTVPGDYEITASVSDSGSTSTIGTYNTSPAKWTLHVTEAAITDADGDGVADADDNCPDVANADQANADGDGLGDACDANSYAPEPGTDAGNTTGDEGSEQTNSGSFTDADGNSSVSITGSGAGVVTDNGDGTWSWAHTPADEGSGTVTVTASDGEHTDAVDTFDWSADNVNPTVAAPDFSTASVDCRNAITLTGISFSDPGVNDDPWTVSIDWGDGSTDDSYSTNDQGAQGTQTHTYDTPGTYTATVTVTDEDGGEASNTSSSSVTVQQTYAVDFLAPFDDSSPSGLIVNKMKNGRVVPVKVTIYDECALAAVTDPTTAVTIATSKTSGTGTGDPVETYADAGQSSSGTNRFRWSSDGFWIYNLDSKALGLVVNNNYRVDAYVGAVKATQDTWAVLQPVK